MKKEILDILKHFVIGLTIGLIISGLMVWSYNVGKRHCTVVTDTDTITDTITNWNYDTMYLSRLDTIKLPVVDTINDTILKIDSILVQIPISTTVYDTTIKKEDYQTNLKAVLSGFQTSVDSVYLSTEIIKQEPKKQPWYGNIGIGAGVMYGTGGWGVGCGIMFKLF